MKKKNVGVKISLNGFNIAFYRQAEVKCFLIVNMIDSDMGKRGFQKVNR